MGTATKLRQLLKGLCHGTQWKYAVFWKLKHKSRTLLAWEDGYCVSPKSGAVMDNASPNGFFSGEPGIISFACEVDIQSGTSAVCPIGLAVANMSCHVYSLGEGIVGKVAFTGKHRWIFANNFNSKVQSEYPDEWHLQFAAGIKTILLVPVVPQGVLQLGSLEMFQAKDLTVVAHIKDLFTSNEDLSNPSSSLSTPLKRKLSAASAVTDGDLRSQTQSKLFTKKDMVAPGIEQINKNKVSDASFHLSPLFMVSDDISYSENDMQHILGMDMGLCMDGSTWKAIYSAISGGPTEESCIMNQSLCSDIPEMVKGDISIFVPENESITPSQCNTKQSAILDPHKKDLPRGSYETMGQAFVKETSNEASRILTGSLLNFPIDSELHKALGPGLLQGHDDCTGDTWLPGEDGLSMSTLACQMEETEVYKSLLADPNQWFTKESDAEHLLDAMVAKLYASDDDASAQSRGVRSPSTSSENLMGSCLTHSKYEGDALEADDSGPRSYAKSALLSRSDVFAGSPTGSSAKSTSLLIDQEQQNKGLGYELYKRSPKLSYVGKRKAKEADMHRQRPRDRQLIQDRVKELRELVPNGAKCSIDALLDRTIKHMLFLRTVSTQAGKLSHCLHPKVGGEDQKSAGTQIHKNGTSWACEVGSGQPDVGCPIIVENLDQPGHMLVEMLCMEYGFFLEIAEVIKHLELTILKGVMETRSDKLWAHFIVEASRGFHRMDILWPLMQLLQRNFNCNPIASKF